MKIFLESCNELLLLVRNIRVDTFITINIRKTLIETIVWSVALYESELWSILNVDGKKKQK